MKNCTRSPLVKFLRAVILIGTFCLAVYALYQKCCCKKKTLAQGEESDCDFPLSEEDTAFEGTEEFADEDTTPDSEVK